MTHLDAVVFTGGIGENSDYLRSRIIAHLGVLGLSVDEARNTAARFGYSGPIHGNDSRAAIWVIPTNEELVIAQDAARLTFNHSQDNQQKGA